jgi:hypothetical protein
MPSAVVLGWRWFFTTGASMNSSFHFRGNSSSPSSLIADATTPLTMFE